MTESLNLEEETLRLKKEYKMVKSWHKHNLRKTTNMSRIYARRTAARLKTIRTRALILGVQLEE